ncbi:FAD-dependent oxidoreductase [Clostridium felsineum]|uniref:oxidoreductase n=1 Tax=Clostridium felsineum TaxID=36839 RepID=UPI00098C13D9|nr:FAD-dependent oxidoreductase [Clostridium felsineum]URZ14403.1 NADH oxidase [Clostridium felsineum DSM 794]
MKSKYPNLCKPITLGNVTFKNRMFSAPVSLQEISPELTLNQENIAFFELRAKGGAANCTIGVSNVLASGSGHTKELALDNQLILPSLAHMARTIKRHDCVPNIELTHAGKYAGVPNLENPHPKYKAYGPTYEIVNGTVVRQMDEGMILDLVDAFGKGAALVKKAGFEMLIIHGGHGWLISQFLSPTNNREDKYGGSLENRLRFPIMILKSIREAVGPGFPIEFRMNGLDYFEGGYGLDEAVEIAKGIEDYVDMIHISVGNQEVQETFVRTHPDMFYPHGLNVELAAEIKKNVKVPVAVVGAISDPEKAEEIIASGKADVVEMARALIVDPFFPTKVKEGRDEDIRKCMRCHVCFDTIINIRDVACALNPVIGEEELYFSPPAPPAKLKKVLVAGGGPGGMQAALTAAKRGHKVILCEASDKLGGQILCEAHVEFKKNYYGFAKWLQCQLKKQDNVEIRLNTKVDEKLVDEINPDSLICAIGAYPIVPRIPGIEDERVVFCDELAKDKPKIGNKVVIIGAGLVGSESAIHFKRENKEVTLIEARGDYAIDANPFHKMGLTRELREGVDVRVSTSVKAITKEGVVAVDKAGNEIVFPADTILCAVGMRSRADEVKALRDKVMEFRAIGDCVRPGKAMTAVHHGHYAALDL